MRFKLALSSLIIALATSTAGAKDYKYYSVPGDPMQTRIYTLDNGLKVYLSVNKEKPRLQTYIAVRTGSRNDPAKTTGLAHYLEHLMFKGTNHFGTTNMEKERPLLDSIESRFEQYRYIVNNEQRKKWYHQIDSISQLAAQYNIPNEYDKMMASIGSEGSDAYTSNDVTCYIEDIPSNEIDTWAKIQSDRFKNMVIRGFHTELEAVYEEFNMGLARDVEKEWVALYKKLYPTHPYGFQTTIGTQEHLKNPSITNIKNYFKRYYVPNNVAVVMAGDFDPDNTIAVIDKYFGDWQPAKTVTRPEYAPVADLKLHTDTTVVGQESENIILGWKFDKTASAQADTINVIADIMANGKAGLLDTDLKQPMKIMDAGAYCDNMTDYTSFIIEALPKQGQKLEELRSLIINEIDKLKKGDFDDDLITSVVNNKKLQFYKNLANNQNRTEKMKNAFINGQDWKDVVGTLARQEKMTKKQIVDFANRHLNDNYACVFKVQGEDTTIHKIEKPEITPIPTNNDKQSDFLKSVVALKPEPIQPRFTDFSKDLTIAKMKDGSTILYKKNTEDNLFKLSFSFPYGTENDNALSIASMYLDYVGTDKLSANDIKKQFYKLACDYSVNVSDDRTRITLEGLNDNMPAAMTLLSNLINNSKADNDSYNKFVELILKNRRDDKANQRNCFNALFEYGKNSTYNRVLNRMSEKELKEANPQQLLDKLKGLGKYTFLYYGPTEEKAIAGIADKNFKAGKLTINTNAKRYTSETTPKQEVILAPYDAKNIYMVQYHNENRDWTPDNAAVNALFNEYFGGGMNAIVFQELREARGLAYSAYAGYNEPSRKSNKESFNTYIITQNDKMTDCINEFNNLLNNMPQRPAGFELAKQSLMKSLATNRTNKFDILNAYVNAQRLGIDYDINKKIYETLPSLQMKDLTDFAKSRISNKTYKYIILGNEKELNMPTLEKIGNVKRLSLEQIFGF